MEYRKIEKSDDPSLAIIIRKNLKAHKLDIPGTAYFDDNLDHLSDYYLANADRRFYLVATEDGSVVGGIGVDKLDFFENCAELQKLYLDDSVKGHGYGYEMIRMIEDKARELGYGKIYLETHTNLPTAIHMYEKSCYREIDKPEGVIHSTMNKFFLKDL